MTSVAPSPGVVARAGVTQRGSRRARLALGLQALVEISADRLHQSIDLAVEEMIGARDHLLLDHDALLGLELFDEAADVLVRHHRILVAVNDHAGGGTGGEERKIIEVGGWSDRDESLDLRTPHEQLHPDPGAEGETGDPAAPGLRVYRLRPAERRGGIRHLALAITQSTPPPSHPPHIQPPHRKVP